MYIHMHHHNIHKAPMTYIKYVKSVYMFIFYLRRVWAPMLDVTTYTQVSALSTAGFIGLAAACPSTLQGAQRFSNEALCTCVHFNDGRRCAYSSTIHRQ